MERSCRRKVAAAADAEVVAAADAAVDEAVDEAVDAAGVAVDPVVAAAGVSAEAGAAEEVASVAAAEVAWRRTRPVVDEHTHFAPRERERREHSVLHTVARREAIISLYRVIEKEEKTKEEMGHSGARKSQREEQARIPYWLSMFLLSITSIHIDTGISHKGDIYMHT